MPRSAPPGDQNRGDGAAGLSAWQAGALVVGSMVGTGIFTTTGLLCATLGGSRTAVLATWALGGLLALCGAAVYAEIGAMFPRVGGEYVYLARAFHPAVGFVSGWLALLVGFAAPMAAGAAAFGTYLTAAVPGAPAWGASVASVTLIVAVTALHARDVVWAARLQLLVTAATITAMVVIVVVAGGALLLGTAAGALTTAAEPGTTVVTAVAAPGTTAPPSLAALAVALVLVSYSYFGWNAAAYVAGELRHPDRALPRALLIGCGLVTAIYVALNIVYVTAVPTALLAGKIDVAHAVVRAMAGEGAARAVSSLIALVLAGSVSALAMTGPRVYLAMAQDGLFLPVFARRNRRGAPTAGVALQGALALVLTVTAAFDALLLYVGFTLSVSAAATVAATAWLRRTDAMAARPFRTPLWPLPPLLFFAFSAWMTVHAAAARPRETAAGAATIAAGFAVYWLWRGRRSARARPL